MLNDFSLILDSFILLELKNKDSYNTTAIIAPGIRIQTKQNAAFGFGAIYIDGNLFPSPIPVVQWFKKIK